MSWWVHIDDEQDLLAARDVLLRLESSLERERQAVSQLRSDALIELNEEKRGYVAELQVIAERSAAPGDIQVRPDGPEHRELRRSVRDAAIRVRAHTYANAALLRDAIDGVALALGLRTKAATYDRNAKVLTTHRPTAGKAA